MSLRLVRFTALAAVVCVAASQNTTGPIVDLGYGQFRGTVNTSVRTTTYFGLRYAQPPVGELRFRAPRPIEGSTYYNPSNVTDATQAGPQCVQGIPGFLITPQTPVSQPGEEDCLLADVLVPNSPVDSSLPVLVQIHGGGYTLGSSESYPGYALVNQSQAIIYVSIQYRLSAFGFLSSVEVRENGDANAGLLDQRAALNWVERNIRFFGGDPNRITIIGGSAGGGSVMNQMILYGGDDSPPFRAAISEYPWWQPYHNDTVLGDQYREVLTASNCTNLACLRSISALDLDIASQAAQRVGFTSQPAYYGHGDFYYGPAVDGDSIRDLPSNEFKKGHFTKVPLLVDHDGYEGVLFSNTSATTESEALSDLQSLFPYAKQSFFARLLELYPSSAFNSTFFQRQQLFGDFVINCPTYYMTTALSDYSVPTYKLIFNAGSQLHGATLPFLFSTNASAINNATLALAMKDWFTSFAVHLDPNVESWSGIQKPNWPVYQGGDAGGFSIMSVNYTEVGVVQDADASAQCDFWHGQSYVVRN
ncbi:Secreted lipase [Sphaceloma murrayae]|uniref:Carboxylic ester hydrolase n=1 Tax=Sphaceloma murrayae TaxID=2082308 RepID=A0A2K1QYX1_9PEZI|nr:Secreted lipase [Sphaceloma murrayae]